MGSSPLRPGSPTAPESLTALGENEAVHVRRRRLQEAIRIACGHDLVEAGSADEAFRLSEASEAFQMLVADIQVSGPFDDSAIARHLMNSWPQLLDELCLNLGDAVDQAAFCAGVSVTSTPLVNLTPWTTLGN